MGESKSLHELTLTNKTTKKIPQKAILVLGILLLKFIYYFLFIKGDVRASIPNCMFIENPDRYEYLDPIDNYLEHGTYSLFPGGAPYAGRLPGFIFPYMLFRTVFGALISNWLLGFFILGMSILASLKLTNLLYSLTSSVFYTAAGLLGIEVLAYYWHWDWTLHPNSLAISCLIIAITQMYHYFQSGKMGSLFIAGCMLAWVFMLRGFTFMFIPVTLLVLFIFMMRNQYAYKKMLYHGLVFCSSVIVFESAWIVRNFISLQAFIPLQTSFVPGSPRLNADYGYTSSTKPSMMKLRELISCWGGDNFWYFKQADMKWFMTEADQTPASQQFKPVVFSGGISASDLEELKRDVIMSYKKDLNLSAHDSLEKRIVEKSKYLEAEFMNYNGSYNYFVAPFNRIANMLIKNPTQDWPGPSFNESNSLKKLLQLISVAIFSFSIVAFSILLVLKTKTIFKNDLLLLLTLYTFSIVITFGFLINTTHYVYFMQGYVPAVILIILLISTLRFKTFWKKA